MSDNGGIAILNTGDDPWHCNLLWKQTAISVQYVERVRALDIEVREGRDRIAGEGRSPYFYDYDNHLFEIHTGTLDRRLAAYLQTP